MAEKKPLVLRRALTPPLKPDAPPSQSTPVVRRRGDKRTGQTTEELVEALNAAARAVRQFGANSTQVAAAIAEFQSRLVNQPTRLSSIGPSGLEPAVVILSEDVEGDPVPYALVPCSQCSTPMGCRSDIMCSRAPVETTHADEIEEFPSGASLIETESGETHLRTCDLCPTPESCITRTECTWADSRVPQPGVSEPGRSVLEAGNASVPNPLDERPPRYSSVIGRAGSGLSAINIVTGYSLDRVCGGCVTSYACAQHNRCSRHPAPDDLVGDAHRHAIDQAMRNRGRVEEEPGAGDIHGFLHCVSCVTPARCQRNESCIRINGDDFI